MSSILSLLNSTVPALTRSLDFTPYAQEAQEIVALHRDDDDDPHDADDDDDAIHLLQQQQAKHEPLAIVFLSRRWKLESYAGAR